MTQTQYIDSAKQIIDDRIAVFKKTNSITDRNKIPADGVYPLKDNYWFKIPDVICVYVDIRNSSAMSASSHDKSTASVYELFTGTAVRLFHDFRASYIDVKGDGVFALFNRDEVFRSLAAAVTFKTFASESFVPLVKEKLGNLSVGFHMGIDQKTVLVKQVGLKDDDDRDSRKNEVWAGKPINMAAKLASRSKDNELHISDRYFERFDGKELVLKSCGCSNNQTSGKKADLWEKVDVSEDGHFDFKTAYLLKSLWCITHGKEWCEGILELDEAN